jgi:hypothetical protein
MSEDHLSTSNSVALSPQQTMLGGAANRWSALFGVLGFAGLASGFFLGWNRGDELQYFLHSYLWNYSFVLSIALGALFFVVLQHATRAGWSVTVRRLAEFFAAPFGLLFVLFLPILIPTLLGQYCIYPWTDVALPANVELAHKAAYLNPTFFGIRCIFYFVVWLWIARYYLAQSVEQDRSGDAGLTLRLERYSYISIILYALTITFAAFDWLMSLTPSWYSTIFGVYYYSGCMLAGMAVLILAAVALQASGKLNDAITIEHYHDLGKLLFTFVVFWGYIAFSQYLLIWYANIPEETEWFLRRQNGDWKWVSLALLFGQLLIPFVALLSRHVKRRKMLLGFWAIWVLAFHWLDLYWVVMPSMKTASPPFSLIDVCLLIGLLGIYSAAVMRTTAMRSLAPLGDPRLGEALAFETV